MVAGPYSSTSALVRGKVIRLTLLDPCGMPLATKSSYVTDGFIQVQTTKNYDNGDEIKVRQANGLIGVYEPGRVSLVNETIQIDMTKINPGVLTMLTGDPAVLDWQTTIVGWEERVLQPIAGLFAVEVWTATSAVKCTAGALISGYMLFPSIGQASLEVDSITDKEINCSIKGQSYGNPSWGRGPYTPVAADAINTPSRLIVAVAPDAHRHFEVTPIPAPAVSPADGPQTIVLPTPYTP